jgi:hypothetical protein
MILLFWLMSVKNSENFGCKLSDEINSHSDGNLRYGRLIALYLSSLTFYGALDLGILSVQEPPKTIVRPSG